MAVGDTRICPDTGKEFIVTWDGARDGTVLLAPRRSMADPRLERMETQHGNATGGESLWNIVRRPWTRALR